MSLELPDDGARLEIPEADRRVLAPRECRSTVGGDGDGEDLAGRPLEPAKLSPVATSQSLMVRSPEG